MDAALTDVLRGVHRLVADGRGDAPTDRELLERFLSGQDETAFAALLQRHGAMVLGVCRRELRHAEDAEDAFQATFLLLARRAASVRKREAVGSWLHGVAVRVARNVRRSALRRSRHERPAADASQPDVVTELTWREVQGALDEELERLPERYRAPLVLCCLEGKSRDEAARQLGWTLTTLKGRLERGRERLRTRLGRRGVTVSAAFVAATLAPEVLASVPARLVVPTVQAAKRIAAGETVGAGLVSARALGLAEGMATTVWLTRFKEFILILALGLAGTGAGWIALGGQQVDTGEAASSPAPRSPTLRQAEKAPRAETPIVARPDDLRPPPRNDLKDWPQWRGPNRDGTAVGVTVPKRWPKSLKEQWKVPVGDGDSSPVVAANRVYVHGRIKDDEQVLCLDLAGGKDLWREKYHAPYKPYPAAQDFPGPLATPVVSGHRIFTFGVTGILSCWDAKNGKLQWRRDFRGQFERTYPTFGAAMSPLVENGLCIVHVGGQGQGALSAFDVDKGELKWSWDGDGPGYGSPIVVDLAGERQVVTLTENHVVGVAAATGKLLWKHRFHDISFENEITPVLFRDLVIFSGRNFRPLQALRIEKKDGKITAKPAWSNRNHSLYMSSPVLRGDLLFGNSDRKVGHVFCVEAATGKTVWETDGRSGNHISLVSAGSVLLLLNNHGELTVLNAEAPRYEPTATYKLAGSRTMSHPVFLGDRILIRDRSHLHSFAVE